MGLFTKKKGKQIKGTFMDLTNNCAYFLRLTDDKLQIEVPFAKKGSQPVTLRYDQITDVAFESDFQKVAVSKSPIGRAVAGGLLFGGAGAIVGAVSGTTKKERTEIKFRLIIAYTSKDGEDKFLEYEDLSLLGNLKFANALKERCGIGLVGESTEL